MSAYQNVNLSIIICCFNGEKHLESTLDSLLKQSYSDYELIFINDGSIDLTEKILLSKVKYFQSVKYIYQENKGLQASRNIGLQNASENSNYVMFLDADDLFDEFFIEKLYSEISVNNSLSSVHCDIEHFPEIYKENYGELYDFNYGLTIVSKRNQIGLFDVITGNHRIMEAASIYRKATLINSGGWDEVNFPKGETYGESVPLLIGLILNGNVLFLREALYFYRRHEMQITSKINVNSNAIKITSQNVLRKKFSKLETLVILFVCELGSKIISFKKSYKYLIRKKSLLFFIYLPKVVLSYCLFYFLRLLLPSKVFNLLFK